MAKKVWYSKTFKDAWQMIHDLQSDDPEASKEQILENFTQFCCGAFYKPDDIAYWQLFTLDYKGDMLHIYFDSKELRDFLLKMKVRDVTGIKHYINDNGMTALLDGSNGKFIKNFAFCLHVPYEKDGYVISYAVVDDELRLFIHHGLYHYHVSSDLMEDRKNYEATMDKDVVRMGDFALNVISYMICFPECLVDGVPKSNEIETERGSVLHTSEKVVESFAAKKSGTFVCPHFRSGYFKMLRSDYFTNKKGQIIFIHETMVKGSAKTLIEKKDR